MVQHETTTETDFRNELIDQLRNHICEAIFTKKDGTERVMNCTLMSEKLPEAQKENDGNSKKENKDILVVWDLDKNAWRSFRIDSLLKFAVMTNRPPQNVPIL